MNIRQGKGTARRTRGIYLRIMAAAVILSAAVFLPSCGQTASVPDEYSYDDLSEYITLGNYKGIEYSKTDTGVTDEEIRAYVDNAVSQTAKLTENTTGTVQPDSVINMDYVGSIDGVEFEGGAASDVEFDIANNNYIAGFAEGIIGHSAGETFDLHVTFPEDYGNAELAGKPAIFKTTINFIIEKSVPEYNDEWVASNTEYKTTAEYEESVRDEILSSKTVSADRDEKLEVWNAILAGTEVTKYPETELSARTEKIINTYKQYAESAGMDFETYLQSQMSSNEEEFNELAAKAAEEQVKSELVLHAIAGLEGIDFSDADYNEYLVGLLSDAGYTEESFEDEKGYTIQKYAEDNNLYSSYLYKKVMDKVMEYSVAK